MKKKNENSKKCIPNFAFSLLSIAFISFLVHFIGTKNSAFAEWITINIGYYIRLALAKMTDFIPFSLAELLIMLSPVILIAVLVIAAKKVGARARIRFLSCFLAVLSLFYTGYVYTLGIGYHRTPLESRIELDCVEITKENLYSTVKALQAESETLLDDISFSDSGSSESDISFDDMSEEIISGYERLDNDFPELNIKTFDSVAKEVHFSKVMTSLEILGVYTYFTGESNVNIHYPEYTAPFTIAHELAHQRGISRENEANFVAFLVCIRADNAYVRYSGYMNMLEYVLSALSRTDKELAKEVYSSLDVRIYGEMRAYSDFYKANKNELLAKISNFVNDNYLKAQGTEGTVSYGLVVELCVSYYNSMNQSECNP